MFMSKEHLFSSLLKLSYIDDNLVCFSIFNIVRVFLAFKNFELNLNFPLRHDLFLAVHIRKNRTASQSIRL